MGLKIKQKLAQEVKKAGIGKTLKCTGVTERFALSRYSRFYALYHLGDCTVVGPYTKESSGSGYLSD